MNKPENILAVIFFCLLILFGSNCSESPTINSRQLIGTWVGTYIQYDEKLPRPRVIQIKPDGSYEADIFEQSKLQANWYTENNNLVMDTLKLETTQPNPDELFIKGRVQAYYRRAINQGLSVEDAQLENTAWESTDPTNPFRVYLNYEKIITEHPDGTLEIRCWKLKESNGLQFFYQRGNQSNCTKLACRLQQIIELNDKEWVLQNFNTNSIEKSTLRKIIYSEESFNNLLNKQQFMRCSEYNLFNCGSLHNYNEQPGLVPKEFSQKFKPVAGNIQSGFLRLKFVVNCLGKTGNYNFEGMDTNYKAQQFDERIEKQLIDITKNCSGWKGYEIDDRQEHDCFVNIIFKFKNGKLLELSI